MAPRLPILLIALTAGAAQIAAADPLKEHNSRLFVSVTINGAAAEALLDSAAEMTFVDTKLAAQLKLVAEGSETAKGSGGPTQIRFAKHVNIRATGVELRDMTVALLDMTDLSRRLIETDLQIILGREFFDAARVRIDIDGGTIEKLDATAAPAGVKLPLTSERGIENVPCEIEGVAAAADIDLGNGSEVLIGRAFAEQHGLLAPGRIVARKEGGGIGGGVTRDIVVLSSLTIAGVRFDNVRAAIDPQPTAGPVNIGTSILRKFELVIDYPGRAAWFKPK